MKRVLNYLIIFATIFSLSGCKEEKTPNVHTQAETQEQKVNDRKKKDAESGDENQAQKYENDATTFETDNGKIRVLGVEKGDPDILRADNAYVVKFEVTNKAAEPREGYSIFYCDVYQNNVEVKDILGRYSKDCEQSDILDNSHKGIMTNGTLVIGKPVVLQDTSEITIFVKDGLDLESKTSFTINVE